MPLIIIEFTTCLPIFDDGEHNDAYENDGVYGIVIPAIEGATAFNYYVEVMDETGLRSQEPRCDTKQIIINPNTFQLYINEFMASNNTTIIDEAGEYDDWLELYYSGSDPLYLGDKYLSDNETIPNKWLMPDITITSVEHLLFWADKEEEQGETHTNFKLSSSGEFIGIFDTEANNFALIDGYTFGAQQTNVATGRIPDGTGIFQSIVATPSAMNEVITAISVVPNDTSFLVYPNPMSDYFTIAYSASTSKQWTAQLIAPLGRVLLSQKLESEINTISTRDLSLTPNIYFLKILNKDGEMQVFQLLIIK